MIARAHPRPREPTGRGRRRRAWPQGPSRPTRSGSSGSEGGCVDPLRTLTIGNQLTEKGREEGRRAGTRAVRKSRFRIWNGMRRHHQRLRGARSRRALSAIPRSGATRRVDRAASRRTPVRKRRAGLGDAGDPPRDTQFRQMKRSLESALASWPTRRRRYCLRPPLRPRHPGQEPCWRSITSPTYPAADASRLTSRRVAHGSRSGMGGNPLPQKTFFAAPPRPGTLLRAPATDERRMARFRYATVPTPPPWSAPLDAGTAVGRWATPR